MSGIGDIRPFSPSSVPEKSEELPPSRDISELVKALENENLKEVKNFFKEAFGHDPGIDPRKLLEQACQEVGETPFIQRIQRAIASEGSIASLFAQKKIDRFQVLQIALRAESAILKKRGKEFDDLPIKVRISEQGHIAAEKQLIGQGSFGEVYAVAHISRTSLPTAESPYSTKHTLAQKVAKPGHELSENEILYTKKYDPYCREISSYKMGSEPGAERQVITTEKFDCNLFAFSQSKFDFETLMDISHQLGTQLNYMHDVGDVHYDVKTDNGLYRFHEGKHEVIFADFGFAAPAVQQQDTPYGSNALAAPETVFGKLNTLSGAEQNKAKDAFAFGCMLYTLYTKRDPEWFASCRTFHDCSQLAKFSKEDLVRAKNKIIENLNMLSESIKEPHIKSTMRALVEKLKNLESVEDFTLIKNDIVIIKKECAALLNVQLRDEARILKDLAKDGQKGSLDRVEQFQLLFLSLMKAHPQERMTVATFVQELEKLRQLPLPST